MSQIHAMNRRQLLVITNNPNIVSNGDAGLMKMMELGRQAFHRSNQRPRKDRTHV